MEDSEKVEDGIEKAVEVIAEKGESEKQEEKSKDAEVCEESKEAAVVVVESKPDTEPVAIEIIEVIADQSEENKENAPKGVDNVPVVEKEVVEEQEPPPQTITGSDEVPDVSDQREPTRTKEKVEVIASSPSRDEPILLTELTTLSEVVRNACKARYKSLYKPEGININDVDEDDEDDVVKPGREAEFDDEDDGDDEDDDGISNEALNADEEQDSYDDEDLKIEKKTLPPHPLDDFDDDYDDSEDDDEDIAELKDEDSNGAVVIGSSDDEDDDDVDQEDQRRPIQIKKPSPPNRKYEDMDDEELDYDDDEDEDDDEYDDDDLMNAVVTSASKVLSSTSSPSPEKHGKKRQRSETPNMARRKEAELISVLTRRINYGRIAKKKSLNWLYSKKKREAYKLILPRRKPTTTAAAMRNDQSGGLLHLKINPQTVSSIVQKSLIKPSASSPTAARVESRAPAPETPQKSVKEEYVIDLDSSPEKVQEKSIPRNQSNDQQNSETSVKKPPDNKEQVEDEPNTMQQTDKVRDSIQKSTEQVDEVKSVTRISSEQNKENLQSNDALKIEKAEESSKNETEPKDTVASDDAMDTVEEVSESTLKAPEFMIASVKSINLDIKEEKLDKSPTPPPPTTEEITASKVSIEDVQEQETPTVTSTPYPALVGASKRRRSSSIAQDKVKTSKLTSGTTGDQDEDEEYIHPTKKLREELQSNYPAHDRILNAYIERTSNDSIDTIQRHIEQMLSEIQTLNDMIKAKEVEWNNMLHLKKVKEEICFRLTRRKQCMEIMSTKVGEAAHSAGLDEDYLGNESALALGKTPPAQKNPQLSSTPITAAINALSSNICNFTAVSSSSSSTPTTAQLIIQNRANMKSSDLVKEKANTQRLHRNILPKPNTASPTAAISNPQSPSTNGPSSAPSSSNQPILNSYLTSADSVQQLVDMMNGHHNNHSGLQNGGAAGGNNNNSQAAMVGRQGPFKDVRSIIADFRQQHPEVVPRRGRRVKNSNNSNLSDSNTILGNALKSDTNSRPSSNDSSSHSMSNTNPVSTNHNNVNSFKDVLAPFAKSQGAATLRSSGGQAQNPPYPEVTLHPVSTPLNASGGQDQPTGSLLHGILTKFSRPNESPNTKSVANQTSTNYISNFSPTLARLLTAPERISASGTGTGGNQGHHSSAGGGDGSGNNSGGNTHHSMPGFGVNLSKVVGHNSEITITPVMNSMHQQSMLQQQLQQQQLKEVLSRAAAAVSANSVKDEHFLKLSSFSAAPAGNDDDAEDSVDRLVIDEGVDSLTGGEEHQRIAPHAIGQEFNENEVPVCQGCKKHEAQFVCAGCGNQWYCSRECQVTAWDDHSEVCTG